MVGVGEDGGVEAVEPVEDADLGAQVAGAVAVTGPPPCVHSDGQGRDHGVQVGVEDGNGVAARRHTADAEVAVRTAGGGENGLPGGLQVQGRPALGQGPAAEEVEDRRAGHMDVGDGAGDGRAAAGNGNWVDFLGEAHKDVGAREAELDKEGRLIGLDPGVDDLGAFDGGGLRPTRGRGHDNAVFARGQILDQQGAGYGIRLQGTVAQGGDAVRGVGVAVGHVAGAERIAEGVRNHRAAVLAVAAGGLLEDDTELTPVNFTRGRVFQRQVRRAVQGPVILEQEQRDLRGGDRTGLHRHRHVIEGLVRVLSIRQHTDRLAADAVARVGQHRDIVTARRHRRDVHARAFGVAAEAAGIALRLRHGGVTGMEAQRQDVIRIGGGIVRIHREGGVLLQDVAEAADRVAGSILHIQHKLRCLDAREREQTEH